MVTPFDELLNEAKSTNKDIKLPNSQKDILKFLSKIGVKPIKNNKDIVGKQFYYKFFDPKKNENSLIVVKVKSYTPFIGSEDPENKSNWAKDSEAELIRVSNNTAIFVPKGDSNIVLYSIDSVNKGLSKGK